MGKKTTAGLVVGGAVVAVAGAAVVLPLIGFTAAGVGGGTVAAAWHASIGNVVAGTVFSSLQSAGILGLATSTKAGLATAGGLTGAAISKLVNKPKES